MKYIYRF